jgi:PKD repeat protein
VKTNIVWLLVAVGSIVGSFVAGPQLSSLNVSIDHENHEQSQIAEAATLPLAVDWHYKIKEKVGDAASGSRVIIDDGYIDAENHCEICTRIEYTPGSLGQAGLAYAFDKPQDLSGANRVTFFMMGEKGGEKVKFKAGGNGVAASSSDSEEIADGITNNTNPTRRENEREAGPQREALAPPGLLKQQFAVTTEEVELENDWRKYSIGLEGLDLKSVTHPFGMEFPGKGSQKQVMIIKHIVYEDEAAVNPLIASTENQTVLLAMQELSVEIIANATNATSSAAIEFRPNVSGGVAPYSLHWNFGNGNERDSEQEGNQTESDQTLTEVFDEPGSYNVTLEAEDSSNQTGTSSVAIDIGPSVTEETIEIDLGIEAKATEPVEAPATVEFEVEVNVSNEEETFEYQWDFGDGTTEDGAESITHTFEEAGNYNVTATVRGSEGQSASSWIVVEVSPALADDSSSNESETIDNSTTSDEIDEDLEGEDTIDNSTATLEDQDNMPPTPGAIDEILAYPGDTVVLDASESKDEDGDEITYLWAQSSGPDVEIEGEDTATPRVEIPDDIEEDGEVVLEVTVSDEIASAEPYTVTINVDYVEAVTEALDDGADEVELAPESEQVLSDWESDCDDIVECLSDEEDDTFVSASDGDGSIVDTNRPELLMSMEDIDGEQLDEVLYVVLRADASKSDDTGYLSFLIGEDGEQEPTFTSDLVSIVTGPDDFGEYRLLLEEDPRSDSEWTVESINSLLAGISYGGGQSEVKVSELSLVVAYSATAIEDEVESEPEEDEETATEEEPEPELSDQEGEDSNVADIPEDEADQQDLSESPAATNSTEDQP